MTTTTTTTTRTDVSVRLTDVHKTYRGSTTEVHALRGVSMELRKGSLTAVVGQSGSGKSTLLNCAAGLDVPTSGRVVVGEQDLTGLSPDALTQFRRDRIGFVFQAYNLIGHLTVAENIQLPLLLGGRTPDLGWQAQLLTALGLRGLEDRLPGHLSGGQAQRVAIARALFTRPEVVFADEPTGALDSRSGEQVLTLLRDTAASLGQTVVLVTHDSRVAATAERVLLIADGVIADTLDAPTAESVNALMLGLGHGAGPGAGAGSVSGAGR
ncbi:ABC transporter ATP-binding protein [Cellulomonas palmilytica]|uniref:ABC transporter ATP-binding protein n=1 Tax=Cellulomonas palmilytica TaxID=2608402 RepID=UPI001F24B8AA|nr:ABC transporter ATP-binding protein [Cellulomonas palmilytica]